MHLIGIELIDCKNTIFKNLKKKGDRLSNGDIFNGIHFADTNKMKIRHLLKEIIFPS